LDSEPIAKTPFHISEQDRETGIIPWHTKFTHLVVVFVCYNQKRTRAPCCALAYLSLNILMILPIKSRAKNVVQLLDFLHQTAYLYKYLSAQKELTALDPKRTM